MLCWKRASIERCHVRVLGCRFEENWNGTSADSDACTAWSLVSAHGYDGATAMREVISAIAGTRENT
jgi:hypothetical protein